MAIGTRPKSAPEKKYTVRICQGPGCALSKSEQIRLAFEVEVKKRGLPEVLVDFTGCHGFCQQGPIVVVEPGDIFYTHVTREDVPDIVNLHLLKGKYVERLFYRDPLTTEPIASYRNIDFYRNQQHLILRNCGHINPETIDDYIVNGGYTALQKVLFQMSPEEVIEEIRHSGLRGRGGAGFPTGQKWEFCRNTPAEKKYMICNADEGDPGAFMDRCTLEGDPHAVLEGMVIAAYAIGAGDGYVYCRAEYPLAIKRLHIATEQARERGFIGEHILGSDFSFSVHVKEGAGAFVCGEETALMASIEGRRGMPNPRPPFPAQSGLWGKPTNINNVKTLASVPVIIEKGAAWYASIGTEKSKGTAVFALAGKIRNSGLVEVPMGTTLREIIYEIGGGVAGGKRFKAVQTGGPSGGCLPASFLDSPVDYETLAKAGSIMGSGGMVVLDEDTCMVDMAKYFLSFTQFESCGKCIPCRWGTRQMLDILEDITNGRGTMQDIDLLIELGGAIKAGSLCGLGQTAPNPVLSTIRYFRDEYVSHIMRAHCPAAVCKGLVKAPCSHACPAGVDVPRYIRRIAEGRYDEALRVIREKIPFPSICGYVCFHPCEDKCRRAQLDEAVAIRALKRFAADHGERKAADQEQRAAPSGKHVAVVGSGPAGLTAAYYLSKRGGHAVTVFEALPVAGGMMRVGIPRYRLPEDVLEREIEGIRAAGVEIRTNSRIDSLHSLRKQGYDAIFLAPGAHAGTRMKVPGEEAPGVIDCVSLLRDVSLGNEVALGQRVAVIGGGNAAIDAARTSLRLGAEKVTILYRRGRDEMPASPEEVREAMQEGVKVDYLVSPVSISRQNGHLAMTSIRMQLGKTDASGRRRPEPLPGSEFTKQFDTIISATGQIPQIPEKMKLWIGIDQGGTLRADPYTSSVSMSGVFAGGDAVSGPASVIEAIAAGRQAAASIDKYLGGKGSINETIALSEDVSSLPKMPEEEGEHYRPRMPVLSPKKRTQEFRLVEQGFSKAAAIAEAQRCLRCDLETE
jgi:NADH-quinone oxidoreductase subunit F